MSQDVTDKKRPTRNSWKKFVYDKPFEEISETQFIELAKASPGWKDQGMGYSYSIMNNTHTLDEYVKEALYQFGEHESSTIYNDCKGYSKTPRIGRAYHSLLKYSGPPRFKHQVSSQTRIHYEQGLSKLRNSFSRCGTLSVEKAILKLPSNTSAGYSFPGKKKSEVLFECRDNVNRMIDTWKEGGSVKQLPCKLALRGHLSKVDENKTRAVWISPMEHIVLESMLFRGFTHQVYANYQWIDKIMTGANVMTRLTDYLQSDADAAFCNTDISGWDSNRCRFILKDIFYSVLKPNMDLGEPWKLAAFEYLVESFIETHLMLPSGQILSKTTGVPSGSFLTLLINSLAVYLVMTSILKTLDVPFYSEKVLGDDFCFKVMNYSDDQLATLVSQVSELALTDFGLIVKPEKVIVTNNVNERKFIGYRVVDATLYRDDMDWFLPSLYPESPVKDLRTSFTRLFAYLLIGGYNSKRFREFYRFYVTGYYKRLKEYGQELINMDVYKAGNLRVFKHVFKVDIEKFDNLSIDEFLSVRYFKIPHFLTLGASFRF